MATLRIQRLTLTDFRAFPGPTPASFELNGKNLLVYGENGAGKSSVFRALSEFFSLYSTPFGADRLERNKNVFSGGALGDCKVEVTFNDGAAPAAWTHGRHPAATRPSGSDQRVAQAALRRACLDYRALLDTNYKHGEAEVNLFETAVSQLLHDFPIVAAGGQTVTIGELWKSVLNRSGMIGSTIKRTHQSVIEACNGFNSGLNEALGKLHPLVGTLLGELIGAEVLVAELKFPGVTPRPSFYRRDRGYEGRTLVPQITYRTHPLTIPQHFLNEARLSALALSMYFAGRLACTPLVPSNSLKLLVLDDVLIGLDHSNRMPVLDVLARYFHDWQIVLLTYDRLWYETAKMRAEVAGDWTAIELFESHDSNGHYRPRIEQVGTDIAKEYLRTAETYLDQGDLRAAAVHARAAFEIVLKKLCHNKGVPIRFHLEPHKLDTDVYFQAIKLWSESQHSGSAFSGFMLELSLYRGTVLNPGSHSTPTTLNRAELAAAIRALRFSSEIPNYGRSSLDVAVKLIAKPHLGDEERPIAAGYLRAAFLEQLRKYCEVQRLSFAFSMKPEKIEPHDLWQHARTSLAVTNPQVVADIEAQRALFIDPLTRAALLGFTQPTLQAARDALAASRITNVETFVSKF